MWLLEFILEIMAWTYLENRPVNSPSFKAGCAIVLIVISIFAIFWSFC